MPRRKVLGLGEAWQLRGKDRGACRPEAQGPELRRLPPAVSTGGQGVSATPRCAGRAVGAWNL